MPTTVSQRQSFYDLSAEGPFGTRAQCERPQLGDRPPGPPERDSRDRVDAHRLAGGSVLLYDDERDGLYFAAATGDTAATVLARYGEGGDLVPIDASKAGAVFRTGQSLVVEAVGADPDHFKGVDENTRRTTNSMVCVPLVVGADRLGVVQLINKRSGSFSTRDRIILEQFASHAAVAIRNARLVSRLLAHMGLYTSTARGRKTEHLVAELTGKARQERMTVMFADMRGFTRLAQTLRDAGQVQALLSQYLTAIANEIIRQDGVVNKLLGDGALALFRGDKAPKRALRAAFDILDVFTRLRETWDNNHNEDLSFLDLGVGIVTDEVIIGTLGTRQVRDFTVLGSAVNLAAAFEHAARAGRRVLVDQNTFSGARDVIDEFDGPETFELRKVDQDVGHRYKRYHIKSIRRTIEVVEADPVPLASIEHERLVQVDDLDALPARPADLAGYYRSSWAVVVGIDTYASPRIPRLSYAVADADAVADTLPTLGFSRERTTLLKNGEATADAIRLALYGSLAAMDRDDRLFVFFAIHGDVSRTWSGEEAYLLGYDADPANLPLTALPMSDLASIGRRLPAKHVLFALDTCFSGYAARREAITPATQSDLRALTSERAVQIITAGTAGQGATEDGGHGIFTKYLLAGLRGWADPERRGLTALKLFTFLQHRVLHHSDGKQSPQYGKFDGEGDFLFLPPVQNSRRS